MTQTAAESSESAQAGPSVEAGRSDARVGRDGEPIMVLAFGGGGFDTAMQLGVAHALIAAGAKPPDAVVGISAGAVNAAALAEILQAGDRWVADPADRSDPARVANRRAGQVARFRAILNAYQAAPGELVGAILPDAYEVEARTPVMPEKLAVHSVAERREREGAALARFGLIRLFNLLLNIRLPVGTAATVALRWLRLRRARHEPAGVRRVLATVGGALALWAQLGTVIPYAAPHVLTVVTGRYLSGLGGWHGGPPRSATRAVLGSWVRVRLLAAVESVVGFLIAFVLWVAAPLAWPVWRTWRAWRRPRRRPGGRARPSPGSGLFDKLLRVFYLDRELGDSHVLRQLFVRLFDPDYYGRLDMDAVVDAAFAGRGPGERRPVPRKALADYAGPAHVWPIHVAPVVADVSTGKLVSVAPGESVVDALMAATALVPLFRAQRVRVADGGREAPAWCVDGLNLANEPTSAVIGILRDRAHPRATAVHLYPVSGLPVAAGRLPSSRAGPYVGLVDVLLRANQLSRFRDAYLERKLVKLYARLVPPGPVAVVTPAQGDRGGTFLGARVCPIDAERPVDLTERLLITADRAERTRLINQAVADGCRAALQAMMPDRIRHAAGGGRHAHCHAVLAGFRPSDLGPLPGTDPTLAPDGPGVAEVCRNCQMRAQMAANADADNGPHRSLAADARAAKVNWPEWPADPVYGPPGPASGSGPRPPIPLPVLPDRTADVGGATPRQVAGASAPHVARSPTAAAVDDAAGATGGAAANARAAWVTLVFSGGVFRSIFQIGVVNAVHEMGLTPNLIVGSSVGSIMAAMVARVYATPDGRTARICRLAAANLTLDQILVTDRLADLARRLILRAAGANFSLRDLDVVFRRYDKPWSLAGRRWRRVVAGLERLFYVSPYELNALVRAVRLRRHDTAYRLLRLYLQEFLDRHHVGDHVLGAEPLAMLIAERVLERGANPHLVDGCSVPFDYFNTPHRHFLATTTNLTEGRLEILGESLEQAVAEVPRLVDGLLASSAFPGAYRPRWGWEVYPGTGRASQYADGGVMDNLPLDAAARFLDVRARAGRLVRRPMTDVGPVPHLVLTASLEVDPPPLTGDELERTALNWRALWGRARQLSRNKKVDGFAKAQREFRALYEARQRHAGGGAQPGSNAAGHARPSPWDPLDLEVIAIKPKWLCGTLSLHPLVGFNREQKAASIAHGCALALWQLSRIADEHPAWGRAWKVSRDPANAIDASAVATLLGVADATAAAAAPPGQPTRAARAPGACWFRPGAVCPFSAPGLAAAGADDLSTATRDGLSRIYHLCGRRETHTDGKL